MLRGGEEGRVACVGSFSPSLSESPCPAQVLLVLFQELMRLPKPHGLMWPEAYFIIAKLVFTGNS